MPLGGHSSQKLELQVCVTTGAIKLLLLQVHSLIEAIQENHLPHTCRADSVSHHQYYPQDRRLRRMYSGWPGPVTGITIELIQTPSTHHSMGTCSTS